jgi:hypothetical protein
MKHCRLFLAMNISNDRILIERISLEINQYFDISLKLMLPYFFN